MSNPMTNAEIQAAKSPQQIAAERGQKAQVSTMLTLKRSYQLVSAAGRLDASEIRDNAEGNRVVFSGTYAECVAEAKRRGIWYS